MILSVYDPEQTAAAILRSTEACSDPTRDGSERWRRIKQQHIRDTYES